jgi:sigma-E factor negative regulatory protein RseB
MTRAHRISAAAALLVLCGLSPVSFADPAEWLGRMAVAVQTASYEGTVIRETPGKEEILKVLHTVADGKVRERLVAQEGDELEIIRNGSEVHFILPERKSVVVEQWNDQSTLFSTLPSSNISLGAEYDVSLVGDERVAGRTTVLIAIRPHDDFRFGHRLWLDRETGFPLRSRLIGTDGRTLEEVKFVTIAFENEIAAAALEPSYNTHSFKWYAEQARKVTPAVETAWRSDNLPSGFRIVSTQEEIMPGSDSPVTHILFSDGVASVSVFIDRNAETSVSERSTVGKSNAFSTVVDDHRVTAIGDVPELTVERIATSMRLN